MTPVPSYAAKRDSNEPEIIVALQAEGFDVMQNSARGVWDLFIADRRQNREGLPASWAFVEVKSASGDLTPAQEEWAKRYPRFPKAIVRSVADAQALAAQLKGADIEADTPASWRGR